jgi:hypothetical protein
MIPFEGFAPDLPPETPGIFIDCQNIIPSIGLYVGAPSPVDCGLGAIDSAARGFVVTRDLSDTTQVFAGSTTKLYQQGSGAWVDRSKVGDYSLGPDDRWRFTQFGNVTLATCKSSEIQFMDALGTAFDDAGNAPKAEVIEVINNQVFAFNINGMGFGDDVTRWACSAIGDYADWTPSVSTQCVSGQLLDSPGPITAGKQLGDIIVAYKERAMYVGQYVGTPLVWDFKRIPGDIGTACQEAVVSTGTAHFFIGPDDFYLYDGSRPQSLNSPCRNWFFNNADQRYMYKACGTFDRINYRVYWWFASRYSNGALDKCIVYNIKTNKWGRMDSNIEFVADYISSGVTYDQLGSLYATYNDLPSNISYNSPFWSSGSSVVAVFGTDHKAYQLSGVTGESKIFTGHYGDNMQFTTCSRIRPRFIQSPTSSTMNYSYSNTDASTFTSNITSTYSNNWYDFIWSARWHKFELVFNGPMAISGFDLVMSPDGIE